MHTLRTRLRHGVAVVALVGAAFGLSACGGSESADLENGKKKFAACGGCHTLADAGTAGTTGPNLDDAFRGARRQGFEPSSFEGVIEYWIANPEALNTNNPAMPANIVTGQDAKDVAAYIAAVAGTDEESPARRAEEIE